MGTRFVRAQDLVVQRAGLQVLAVGVGRMVVLWPRQDARETRPMKCPEAGR
jgi:hypothetical protein